MTIPNVPIVNAGLYYVNKFNLAWVSTTTMTVSNGGARDSTNSNDILLAAPVTINGTFVGPNGVDVAAIVASSFYAVYVIASSTSVETSADELSGADAAVNPYPAAALLSLASNAAPFLPYGYDMYRRVGWVLTDSSSHFLKFWQYGAAEERSYYYDVGISALSAGAATSFTAINLATSVPPRVTQVLFDISYTPNAATNVAQFLPFGSTATNGVVRFGCGVAAAQVGSITVPSQLNGVLPEVLYKVAASDSLTLLTIGYKDFL